MSWIAESITKAESLLNKIDQSAAVVLKPVEQESATATVIEIQPNIPKVPSSKNILNLKATPKKVTVKNDFDDRWESMSSENVETMSRQSSETVISQKPAQIPKSSSNASLNSFSVEKELAASKILASELRSENHDLKSELETIMEQMKENGNSDKVQELQNFCAILQEEKNELIKM